MYVVNNQKAGSSQYKLRDDDVKNLAVKRRRIRYVFVTYLDHLNPYFLSFLTIFFCTQVVSQMTRMITAGDKKIWVEI